MSPDMAGRWSPLTTRERTDGSEPVSRWRVILLNDSEALQQGLQVSLSSAHLLSISFP